MKEKMVLGFLCAAVIFGLAGCKAQQSMTPEDKTNISAEQVSDTTTGDKSSAEVPSDGASDIAEPTAKAEPSAEEKKVEKTETGDEKTPPVPSGSAADTATKPTESSKPTVPPIADSPPKAEPEPLPVPEPIRYAGADDCKVIADLVVEYINGYRDSPATKLPGLTAYAEYRSRQIVTNFAHDTLDERAAATALKYGEYVEPSLYGMTGEPYFTANARDAIGRAGYRGTVEYVAEQLALQFKNSAGHWAYVGDAKYRYIAVGVTYDGGMWYCDVSVALENTDDL